LDLVDSLALHWQRDVPGVTIRKQHRDELGAYRTCIIEILVDQSSFPKHAVTYTGFFFPIYSPEVNLGADHQDEARLFELGSTPSWPTFGRKLNVLVDHCIDAVGSEPVGQFEHAVSMLRAVVAIADEDPWRRTVGHGRLFSLSSSIVGSP
jgi:hypothetical protein